MRVTEEILRGMEERGQDMKVEMTEQEFRALCGAVALWEVEMTGCDGEKTARVLNGLIRKYTKHMGRVFPKY